LHAGAQENLTAAGFANPLVLLIVSMVIGAIFGWVSGAVAKAMTKSA
jgi:subtilase family serine protease